MSSYKVGDKVWCVPGYRDNSLIAVECTIVKIDDSFRKKHPDAYLFYWVDEPTGHALDEDELYTFEEAKLILLTRKEMLEDFHEDERINCNADLIAYRTNGLKFIVSTWEDAPEEAKNVETMLKNYPAKERGKNWFNISDLVGNGWKARPLHRNPEDF